jgi:Rrf2 family transcriptional regulator, cysteine metabolism repressor
MALMSRKVDYALLILSHLHTKPEGACAREIADRFGLSRAFVANILKEICHRGFVTSHRGVKGGYVLARPAETIRLSHLVDGLDDPFHMAECNQNPPVLTHVADQHAPADAVCPVATVCPIRGPIAEVDRRIRELLQSITLAELFAAAPPPVMPLVPRSAPQPVAGARVSATPEAAANQKVLIEDF